MLLVLVIHVIVKRGAVQVAANSRLDSSTLGTYLHNLRQQYLAEVKELDEQIATSGGEASPAASRQVEQ